MYYSRTTLFQHRSLPLSFHFYLHLALLAYQLYPTSHHSQIIHSGLISLNLYIYLTLSKPLSESVQDLFNGMVMRYNNTHLSLCKIRLNLSFFIVDIQTQPQECTLHHSGKNATPPQDISFHCTSVYIIKEEAQ